MVWALLLPSMLGLGSPWASPALSFLALVDMTLKGEDEEESHSTAQHMGALHFGMKSSG